MNLDEETSGWRWVSVRMCNLVQVQMKIQVFIELAFLIRSNV